MTDETANMLLKAFNSKIKLAENLKDYISQYVWETAKDMVVYALDNDIDSLKLFTAL